MELPKFVLADNTDLPEDIFVIHLDFPRFIINMANDEIELLEEIDEAEEAEVSEELEKLIVAAGEFYDREMDRYDGEEEEDEEEDGEEE
ncbi:MAG: hypothetical protein ACOVLC_04400 [Flavobacterium sp.]